MTVMWGCFAMLLTVVRAASAVVSSFDVTIAALCDAAQIVEFTF